MHYIFRKQLTNEENINSSGYKKIGWSFGSRKGIREIGCSIREEVQRLVLLILFTLERILILGFYLYYSNKREMWFLNLRLSVIKIPRSL